MHGTVQRSNRRTHQGGGPSDSRHEQMPPPNRNVRLRAGARFPGYLRGGKRTDGSTLTTGAHQGMPGMVAEYRTAEQCEWPKSQAAAWCCTALFVLMYHQGLCSRSSVP